VSKISELSDGGSLVSSDYLIAVRSGGNVKVRMDQINVDQVDLGDNEFIRLGNSQDLTMVHTSTQSIINQAGIGDLLLQKAGATKLTINATGIDVTGSVTADGLTVDGQADFESGASLGSGLNVNRSGHPSYGIVTGGNTEVYHAVKPNGGSWQTYMKVTDGGDISFYEDTGTTPKFFWDASAESLGIGVTPTEKLDISQSVNNSVIAKVTNTNSGDLASARVEVHNNDSSFGQLTTYSSGFAYNVLGSNAANWTFLGASGSNSNGLKIGTLTADPVVFGTSDLERMRIDASGNVGIGMDSPNYSLTSYKAGANANYLQVVNGSSGPNAANGILYGLDGAGNGVINKQGAGDLITSVAGTERMRIDVSGNLLVGKSASSFTTAGVELAQGGTAGKVQIQRSSSPLTLVNLTDDGSILGLYKGTTIVGSIGVKGADLTIGSTVTGLQFYDGGDALAPVNVTTNTNTDGATDLGISNTRFKDLYLSGGVYLGGTGASNKLEDYEEGTWTPNIAFGGASVGVTYFAQQGNYTKVGRLVQATGKLYVNAVGSSTGDFTITGLPFTLSASANSDTAVAIRTDAVSYADVPAAFIIAGTSYITFTETTNAGTGSNLTNANIAFGSTITFTASYFV